ncbi:MULTISPECIES: TIGR01777 family oxidoreductase [Sphingobacterium]|uniref:TIGR01777 family oxidoreductase n=1 Tax=Sphingobacterium TaxID=28453 RepID=UPI0013DC0D2C|nr:MULTISPECIES: TIGR01777 family oxidoreductase [unclassified Sphingobacterium]
MKIVLAGGSGHLGRLLTSAFLTCGMDVFILTRDKESVGSIDGVTTVYWDGETIGEWVEQLEGVDTVINLTGKSIQCRFTARNRKLLRDSRVGPTKLLAQAIQGLKSPPRLWINFSGISIFGGQAGLHSEESMTYGTDFLALLAHEWEKTFNEVDLVETKKVILRISPVLTKDSGMFSELFPLVKIGLGGAVGDGGQMVSWIHEADLVEMVLWIIGLAEPASIYHACSPHPVRNAEFMKIFREEAKVSFGVALPTPVARIGAFFKGIDASILLQTVAVTTKTTIEDGFKFKYSYLHSALAQLIKST